ncbi:MAG: DUF5131 family protein [Actinomycetota bacterium]
MSTKIEWCDETINPLGWGCYGPGGYKETPRPCSYCYAREFAARNLRGCELCHQFIPHWHQEQLEKPAHWRKPRTIFVQSMGDLFHAETPKAHIDATLAACHATPRHTYMFLTKNPGRYKLFDFSDNCRLGTTITNNDDAYRAQELWEATSGVNAFVSLEPLLGLVDRVEWLEAFDLLIVGAMTGDPKKIIKPEKAWLESVIATGHPNILWKKNVRPFLEEYGLVV